MSLYEPALKGTDILMLYGGSGPDLRRAPKTAEISHLHASTSRDLAGLTPEYAGADF